MAAEKITPVFLDEKQMMEMFNVKWSKYTLKRRIKDGLPAIRDGKRFLFDPKAVFQYFKRRTVV